MEKIQYLKPFVCTSTHFVVYKHTCNNALLFSIDKLFTTFSSKNFKTRSKKNPRTSLGILKYLLKKQVLIRNYPIIANIYNAWARFLEGVLRF